MEIMKMYTLQINMLKTAPDAWETFKTFETAADVVRCYCDQTHAERVTYGYRVLNADGSIDEMPDFMYQHAKEVN